MRLAEAALAVELILFGIAVLGLGYTALLGLAAAGRRRPAPAPGPPPRVAVLVPAHNEGPRLGALLADLAQQRRAPASVLVVADSCTDDTVAVARGAGAEVLEISGGPEGKPRALVRGLERLRSGEWDAVLVVDADCRLGPDFVEGIATRPEEAAQSAVALVPGGERKRLYAFLSRLENEVFHAGRAALRLPAFLRGTGMILGRTALDRRPWSATGVTEDRSQGLGFLAAGIPVRYARGLRVESSPPGTVSDAWTQRRRWSGVGLLRGVAAALGAVPGGRRAMGLRALELPVAALADARSAWMLAALGALLLDAVSRAALAPFIAAWMVLGGLGAAALGVRWYGIGFLRIALEVPAGAGVALGSAFLAAIGRGPGRWNRSRREGAPPLPGTRGPER